MGQAKIVLGTDSGTFWTGLEKEPWSDDPLDAAIYNDPRAAWAEAQALRSTHADYLEDSPVELYLIDTDGHEPTRRVVSTDASNKRPLMRVRWREGFGQALPPDLPNAVQDLSVTEQRLAEYFDDLNGQAARDQPRSPSAFVEGFDESGLDESVRQSLDRLRKVDPQRAASVLRESLPTALPSRSRGGEEPQSEPQHLDVEGAGGAEPNEILRIRERDLVSQDSTPLRSSASLPCDGKGGSDSHHVPAFVARHFVQSEDRFYYRQNPEQLAFEARGATFRAHDTSVSVATAMVEMAEAQGWSALRVRGTKDFRRLVWAAAAKRGLSVQGYSPSAGERAMLEQDQETFGRRQDVADSRADGRQRVRTANSLAGILVDRGAAPYQNQQGGSPSYFVSLHNESGSVATHWGLDLERAANDSGAQVGDQVRLAREGKHRVQIQEPVRDQQGTVVDYVTKDTERNRWSVVVLSRSTSPDAVPSAERGETGSDSIAAKVVERFTAERLGRLPPEDRARFRELYDRARGRLSSREIPNLDDQVRPDRNSGSRDHHLGRAVQGR